MFQVPLINLNSFELVFLSACQFLDLVSPPLDFFCLTSFLSIFDYLPKLYRVQIPVYIFNDLDIVEVDSSCLMNITLMKKLLLQRILQTDDIHKKHKRYQISISIYLTLSTSTCFSSSLTLAASCLLIFLSLFSTAVFLNILSCPLRVAGLCVQTVEVLATINHS